MMNRQELEAFRERVKEVVGDDHDLAEEVMGLINKEVNLEIGSLIGRYKGMRIIKKAPYVNTYGTKIPATYSVNRSTVLAFAEAAKRKIK